jgi:thiaminase
MIDHPQLSALQEHLVSTWKELFSTSRFIQTIERGEVTKPLYALYLLETYHYTRHNARNQAVVGVRCPEGELQYQRFCFEHAAEEVGHEHMALHDLKSLGVADADLAMPPPLPATTVLTGYLYWISYQGNPLQRLGYSFWAESCYEYVIPLLRNVQQRLELTNAQMTFFISHAEIDADHSKAVNDMLCKRCKTHDDWSTVAEVMRTSLRLTGAMMDNVFDEHTRLMTGKTERCAFLRGLQ